MITLQELTQIIPKNKDIEKWYDIFTEKLLKYEINTDKRISSFISQCAYESDDFTILKENFNYRWQRLRVVFPKYFPTDDIAKLYASKSNKKEAIPNRVYANRMENGPEESGDGYRYCGRGIIQLTGKHNYTKFANAINMPLEQVPNYLETPEGALHSACWFWKINNLNELADVENHIRITEIINGGYNGLQNRIDKYNEILKIIKK